MLRRGVHRSSGAGRSGRSPQGVPDARLLPRLTALRAFAALAVFLYHLDVWGLVALPGGVSRVGFVGVTFFFVLSGFVLAWGTRPDLSARTFWRRRFARVYPSHLVVLAAAAIVPLVPRGRGAEAAVANVLLVQAWSTDGDVVYGMNGVAWTLSCEAFFYSVFPLAVLVVRRLPSALAWSLACLGPALAVVAAGVQPALAGHLPPVRAAEFLLGLVAGIAVRDGWRPRTPAVAVALALVAGLLVTRALPGLLDDPLLAASLANPVMTGPLLLVVLHMAGRDLDGRPGWLTGRALVFAGEVSFAFYLVHELVIVNLDAVLGDRPVVEVPVVCVTALAAAVLLHLGVERPCNRLLRDRAPSLALARPASPG